ncbi:MAG: phosphate acyltransferase PlsX [Gracilibacteraceae bacterium]|jgi:glycerol-3-phosphate acyltransferase PlsX|nr:phosphate acyltransferase PlsX [Gracilibacteraceae bacterium]
MRIALDAMGGDYAPQEIVLGGLDAAAAWPDLTVIFVGREEEIRAALPPAPPPNIAVEAAAEVVGMDEHPAGAVQKKKNSSIVVATRLVKEGRAEAVVSAGSTGAQMAAALFGLGRIKGVERPGIGSVIPGPLKGRFIVDIGANVDAAPAQLVQYGLMGSIYSELVLGFSHPRVALLNIGAEEGKGNALSVAAYALLKQSGLNFIGNIEGRDLFTDRADVIVCEAFAGNIAIKTMEGVAAMIMDFLRDRLPRAENRGMDPQPLLAELKAATDYAEFGGAPLLGVNGLSIVCHGSSKALAVKNGLRVARECAAADIVGKISRRLAAGGV